VPTFTGEPSASAGSISPRRSAASSFDLRRWKRVFEERREQSSPLEATPHGREDRLPSVRRILRVAAYFERRGLEVLRSKAEQERQRDPEAARCLEQHALEEEGHSRMLQQLLDGESVRPPSGPVAWAERLATRERRVEEQVLVTLIVEAVGIALYETLAEGLAPGRVAEAFRMIADDERVHVDFMREFLIGAMRGATARQQRRLRRLRTLILAVVLLTHAVAHRTFLRPVLDLPASAVRARIIAEVERCLYGLPGLSTV
jgi:rubrerythrin